MRCSANLLASLPLALGLAAATPALAETDLPHGTCVAGETGGYVCDLRAVVPAWLTAIDHVEGIGSGETLVLEPFEGTAAYLMLVDTTHATPIGLRTDDRYGGIRADLIDMMEASGPRRLIEVQAYNGELDTLTSFGAPVPQAIAGLEQLRAQTAEPHVRADLYLSALGAIDTLAALDADRKALVLFTDGLHDAPHWSLDGLVGAAEAADITIIGMAYVHGEAGLANHLGIRELASRTQGTVLYPSMTNQRLSDDNLRGFFGALDNGGTIELAIDDPSTGTIPVRAQYSDGRTMDGVLSLP